MRFMDEFASRTAQLNMAGNEEKNKGDLSC